MSTEENKALAHRVSEELYSSPGNLDAADEIYAPNAVAHDPNSPEEIRGPEAIKQLASMFRSAFPDMQVTVEDQIAEGDKVVTRYTVRGTHQGELMGIPPTGNRMEQITGIYMSRISEGKIVEEWYNYDALGMLQAIGAIPE